jgi:hypothetical protein
MIKLIARVKGGDGTWMERMTEPESRNELVILRGPAEPIVLEIIVVDGSAGASPSILWQEAE